LFFFNGTATFADFGPTLERVVTNADQRQYHEYIAGMCFYCSLLLICIIVGQNVIIGFAEDGNIYVHFSFDR
jgi:hypothetical protein